MHWATKLGMSCVHIYNFDAQFCMSLVVPFTTQYYVSKVEYSLQYKELEGTVNNSHQSTTWMPQISTSISHMGLDVLNNCVNVLICVPSATFELPDEDDLSRQLHRDFQVYRQTCCTLSIVAAASTAVTVPSATMARPCTSTQRSGCQS